MCLKSYILRKTCGFNYAKLKFRFMRNFRKKYFQFCANCAKRIAQNSLRFMRKNSAKVRKKKLRENSANFAQKILPFRGNSSFAVKTMLFRIETTLAVLYNY